MVDDSGAPVEGASLTARPKGEKGNRGSGMEDDGVTNAMGEVELLVAKPGEFVLEADADGFAEARQDVELPADGFSTPVEVALPRSVPCAGSVVIAAQGEGAEGWSYLHVRGDKGSNSGTLIQAPNYTFELDDLSEDHYRAWIYLNGSRGQVVEFDLGPDGDEELVLEFVPETE